MGSGILIPPKLVVKIKVKLFETSKEPNFPEIECKSHNYEFSDLKVPWEVKLISE